MIKKLQDMNILNKFVNKSDVVNFVPVFLFDNLAPLLLLLLLSTKSIYE